MIYSIKVCDCIEVCLFVNLSDRLCRKFLATTNINAPYQYNQSNGPRFPTQDWFPLQPMNHASKMSNEPSNTSNFTKIFAHLGDTIKYNLSIKHVFQVFSDLSVTF